MSLREIYKGRRVFVTGHTGFKGSWLAEWLVALGAEVTGYALEPPTQPNLFDSLGLHRSIRHVLADVRDPERLIAEVTAAQPSVIFHLAAQPVVRRSYSEPHLTIETNVMGAVNVLEAARACSSVRAVVVITSDKCYENREEGRPFRETDTLGGSDPYSASKASVEVITAAYRASFFAEGDAVLASVRAGNVIGGGDWALDRIVPDSARALAAGKDIVVRNPHAERPWQYVLEPLSGYLWLGALLLREGHRFEGAWNFGPSGEDASWPVEWVVKRFLEEWPGSWSTEAERRREPHEAQGLQLDSSKAREQLGWAPVWDTKTAVHRAAQWYRGYYQDPAAARDLVRQQLRDYEAEARARGRPWAGVDERSAAG